MQPAQDEDHHAYAADDAELQVAEVENRDGRAGRGEDRGRYGDRGPRLRPMPGESRATRGSGELDEKLDGRDGGPQDDHRYERPNGEGEYAWRPGNLVRQPGVAQLRPCAPGRDGEDRRAEQIEQRVEACRRRGAFC